MLVAASLDGADGALLGLAVVTGALAAPVQSLGLAFQAFNRYLGVAVGERLAHVAWSLWLVAAGIALL